MNNHNSKLSIEFARYCKTIIVFFNSVFKCPMGEQVFICLDGQVDNNNNNKIFLQI